MLNVVVLVSGGGTKPVGSRGISITEPTKKAIAPNKVTQR